MNTVRNEYQKHNHSVIIINDTQSLWR